MGEQKNGHSGEEKPVQLHMYGRIMDIMATDAGVDEVAFLQVMKALRKFFANIIATTISKLIFKLASSQK